MPSTSEYFLKSRRLGFRLWSLPDLPPALTLWGDPEATRTIGGPFSQAQVQERLEREIAHSRSHNVQYWPVFLLADGDFAGCCGLRPYKPERQIYELGFHFRPLYWGNGFASEAAKAVITYAFGSLGLQGLFAGHPPGIAASARVLQKLGFRYTHHELYAPTRLMNPSYFLPAPR